MFEIIVALKYLLPKKRNLSTALISLLSVFVISLVVWLALVFLSVTTGIEKNWLKKLTSLNATLRISPTDSYFGSYYYQIDKLSAASDYSFKTIGEKAAALVSDPYSPKVDVELPARLPKPDYLADGTLKDPVKTALHSLDKLKNDFPELIYDDYEMSGALMRIGLTRPQLNTSVIQEKTSFLSQMSYLVSLTKKNPYLKNLILKPQIQDLNNLLVLIGKDSEAFQKDIPQTLGKKNDPDFPKKLTSFFSHLKLKKVKSNSDWRIPITLLDDGSFFGFAKKDGTKILIPSKKSEETTEGYISGTLSKKNGKIQFRTIDEKTLPIRSHAIITLTDPLIWKAELSSIQNTEVFLQVKAILQDQELKGLIPFKDLQLEEAEALIEFNEMPASPPLWPYFCNGQCHLPKMDESTGILLPKSYRDSAVLTGDKGYLSYLASSGISTQEQRLSCYVAGFYDPGIMPVGNRCLLVPQEITRTINAASSAYSPDGSPTNGLLVWINNSKQAPELKQKIEKLFDDSKVSTYFKIATYKDYEFSKDLMQQFQSDRTLFTLIAMIIIVVACCNIISLLVLLVNDKKKEIAILSAMGAKQSSIALIFGLCGTFTGLISSVIGTLAAIFTLKHLDVLVGLLSKLQGHAAFQTAFFGNSLPNELSQEAVFFVLIITPIISLVAGLIPAIKAARLKSSSILRAE